MRSLLVVPCPFGARSGGGAGERGRRCSRSISRARTTRARRAAAAASAIAAARRAGKPCLALIHPLASGEADFDLDAVMSAAPDGIILPDAVGGRDIQHLGAKLAVREAENGLPDGSARILALVGDSPAAIFELSSIARATRRLIGIGRDERRLAERLGLAPFAGRRAARPVADRAQPVPVRRRRRRRASHRLRGARRRRNVRPRLRACGARRLFRQVRLDPGSGEGDQRRLREQTIRTA